MTNPTPHGQVPAIQRYKIGYHSDEWGVRSSTPGGISDQSGQWVLYKDHLAALASHGQAPAQAAPAAVVGPHVTDAMALAFHSALSDGAIGSDEVEETKVGLRAALAAAPTPPAQAADSVRGDAARLEALHAAVTAIYLDDSSDFKSALGAVVRHLDPKLAGDLLAWPKRAYDISLARLDVARKQGANHD